MANDPRSRPPARPGHWVTIHDGSGRSHHVFIAGPAPPRDPKPELAVAEPPPPRPLLRHADDSAGAAATAGSGARAAWSRQVWQDAIREATGKEPPPERAPSPREAPATRPQSPARLRLQVSQDVLTADGSVRTRVLLREGRPVPPVGTESPILATRTHLDVLPPYQEWKWKPNDRIPTKGDFRLYAAFGLVGDVAAIIAGAIAAPETFGATLPVIWLGLDGLRADLLQLESGEPQETYTHQFWKGVGTHALGLSPANAEALASWGEFGTNVGAGLNLSRSTQRAAIRQAEALLSHDLLTVEQRGLRIAQSPNGAFTVELGPATRFSEVTKEVGSRGGRHSTPLTAEQRAEVIKASHAIGIDPADIEFWSGSQGSIYSDFMDQIVVGPNIFPLGGSPVLGTRSVLDRLSIRTALAHEYGHLLAARRGIDYPAGIMEEFQANVLAARHTPGLTSVERYQLLRNAIEHAKFHGADWRELRSRLRSLPPGD